MANWAMNKNEDKYKRSVIDKVFDRLGYVAKSTLHTADVLSDPAIPTAEKEIFVNGGRLQPGCYEHKDELDIQKRRVFLALQIII